MAIISRKGKRLNLTSLSILVVDDQPFYRNLMLEVLRSVGVDNVTLAVDGLDALDALESFTPDIIISDWIMPEMDGLELTKKIRRLRDERIRMTPIIMVTSNNRQSQIVEARNCGVDTFVLKPVSLKAIASRIKEVIETPRDFVIVDSYVGPCRRRNKMPENYIGPLRRHDDPVELETNEELIKSARWNVIKYTKQISMYLLQLHQGDISCIKDIQNNIFEIVKIVPLLKDEKLNKICISLNTYIERSSKGSEVRTDIIAKHIEALNILTGSTVASRAQEDEVIRGLQRMVVKAIKAA